MIEEQYVSFECAKLLKEKGFDEEVTSFYFLNGILSHGNTYAHCKMAVSSNSDLILAPTLQMAMRWLREVHHIHVCPEYKAFFQERPKKIYHHWCSKIVGIDRYFKRGINDVDVLDSDYFFFSINAQAYHDSYEEACEECIKFALENLVTD